MTRLGLGCARLGSVAAGSTPAEAVALVRHAIEHGITFLDTADAYGDGTSETIVGTAVEGRRHEVTIATKGGYLFRERTELERRLRAVAAPIIHRLRKREATSGGGGGGYAAQDFSPSYLTAAVESSLRRLRTDHIDLYQLHGPRDIDDRAEVEEWAAAMVRSGKVGRVGIGAEDLGQVTSWLGSPAISSVQLPYGVLDPEAAEDAIPAARAAGKTVVARGVLGAGLLDARLRPDELRQRTDKWPAIEGLHRCADRLGVSTVQLAIWYVRANEAVDTILVGTTSTANADEVAAAMSAPMPTDEAIAAIHAAAAGAT
jgi:aryl-alcohol dehydrogenase-like predicted oxidoreductase